MHTSALEVGNIADVPETVADRVVRTERSSQVLAVVECSYVDPHFVVGVSDRNPREMLGSGSSWVLPAPAGAIFDHRL